MNIVETLKEIKLKKNEIARLISIREETFMVIIPKEISLKDALADNEKYNLVVFDKITDKISILSEKIMILRENLLFTNISTYTTFENNKISLARLKLMIDECRSELAQLNTLVSPRRRGLFDTRKLRSSEDEEKEVPQLNALEVESKIQSLETKKGKLESALEKINANTKLLDPLHSLNP